MRRLAGLSVIAVLAYASTAQAEEGATPARTKADTQYNERIAEGHRLIKSNDLPAALRAYQRALEARRNDAKATYFIACVHRAQDDLDQALTSFQEVLRLAGDDDVLHARALMNVAFVREAQRDLAAAREAWRAYETFIDSHPRVPNYAPNARQRLDAITTWEELDQAYEPVRQRIREGEQPAAPTKAPRR
jgi:tetratricopeptide (TPR) repeat protein